MSYVEEIADRFRSRCRKTVILDPMDYVIIAEWEKQEIPLALVASAIDEAFDRIQGDDPRIDSVGYFQDIVKQNFREWLATGAAKGLSSSPVMDRRPRTDSDADTYADTDPDPDPDTDACSDADAYSDSNTGSPNFADLD